MYFELKARDGFRQEVDEKRPRNENETGSQLESVGRCRLSVVAVTHEVN